ncbi:hypothetical protein GT755_17630 [Herbidospora sp. NEAU-GS84]|uniref:Uncharacterized protein n=1 Tax=Herbidospora solisilvae TaxID=2696284 RepID=A0A7C9J9J9_9ACTN|nr:hypothetical protein [Herbidospora solisilvae]NAS23508.1 hypothetical protein [Herbidospora solisilvae]
MRRASWIGHPLTVLALVVLVVNDHLLKHTWPGVVTGKLSDVAGLILLPAVLDLVLRRPWLSIAVTGVGFTLVKASETGAWLASEAWSLAWGPSVILADPTDLLTLPALYVAWLASRHPVPVGRTVVVLLTPAAVLAITATSPELPYVPPMAFATEVRDGGIIVQLKSDERHVSRAYLTRDGVTWEEWTGAVRSTPTASSCAGDHCLRVVPGRLKVEESTGGGAWTTAWEVSPEVQDRLVRAYPPDEPEDIQPVESLSVSAIPGLVVVANGADGVAVRDAAGTWRRIGIKDYEISPAGTVPTDAPGRYDAALPQNALFIAVVVGLFVLGTGIRTIGFTVGVAVGWVAAWFWLAPRAQFHDIISGGYAPLYPDVGVLATALALPLAAFALMMFFAVMARPPLWILPVGLATAGLTWFVIIAPFEAWSAGWVPTHAQATVLAVVLSTVLGASAAWVTGRHSTPRPHSLGRPPGL